MSDGWNSENCLTEGQDMNECQFTLNYAAKQKVEGEAHGFRKGCVRKHWIWNNGDLIQGYEVEE